MVWGNKSWSHGDCCRISNFHIVRSCPQATIIVNFFLQLQQLEQRRLVEFNRFRNSCSFESFHRHYIASFDECPQLRGWHLYNFLSGKWCNVICTASVCLLQSHLLNSEICHRSCIQPYTYYFATVRALSSDQNNGIPTSISTTTSEGCLQCSRWYCYILPLLSPIRSHQRCCGSRRCE